MTGTPSPAPPAGRVLRGHDVPISARSRVFRVLPHRDLRTVGAWCFADLMGLGPRTAPAEPHIPPHPHLGLQTVTWLLDGVVEHRDSLGTQRVIHPGELNLMTAGRGICHSEQSLPGRHPAGDPVGVHGVQLWIALPEAARDVEPRFEHRAGVPQVLLDGVRAQVLVGSLAGAVSPVRVHSPLLGADLQVSGGGVVPLEPGFEHAVVALHGTTRVAGQTVVPGELLLLDPGARSLHLSSRDGARCLLLGGAPFEEDLVMWWNFVARHDAEVRVARQAWTDGLEHGGPVFGRVSGFDGAPLPAPALPSTRLRARARRPDPLHRSARRG